MATSSHAEVMAAAEAARAAFQESGLVVQGFPGQIERVARAKRKPKEQVSLWDAGLTLPPTSVRKGRKKPELPEPAPTLIQAALRAPPRPGPKFERQERVLLASREVVLIDDRAFVVRTQVGLPSIYSLFVDDQRSHASDAAVRIQSACSEAIGTSWHGLILVSPSGPTAEDKRILERWLLQQIDREAVWQRFDPRAWRTRS